VKSVLSTEYRSEFRKPLGKGDITGVNMQENGPSVVHPARPGMLQSKLVDSSFIIQEALDLLSAPIALARTADAILV